MLEKKERIVAVDTLRGLLMLMGVFYHAAYFNFTYHPGGNITSAFFFVFKDFLHTFRMPLFFFISGYFSSLNFSSKGAKSLIRDRIGRILIPFVFALVIVCPLTLIAADFYTYFCKYQNFNYSISPSIFIPASLNYLWFLYYLFFFLLIALLIDRLLKKSTAIKTKVVQVFQKIFSNVFLRILAFAPITYLSLCLHWAPTYHPSHSFLPDIYPVITFFSFYVYGWLLYKTNYSLYKFSPYSELQVVIAIVLSVLKRVLLSAVGIQSGYTLFFVLTLLTVIITYLLIFGILGMFVKYLNKPSSQLSFLSSASYWVYLVHLIFIPLVPLLFIKFSLHPILLYLINVLITYILCLVTFKLLVERTVIGRFLKGKTNFQKSVASLV